MKVCARFLKKYYSSDIHRSNTVVALIFRHPCLSITGSEYSGTLKLCKFPQFMACDLKKKILSAQKKEDEEIVMCMKVTVSAPRV